MQIMNQGGRESGIDLRVEGINKHCAWQAREKGNDLRIDDTIRTVPYTSMQQSIPDSIYEQQFHSHLSIFSRE